MSRTIRWAAAAAVLTMGGLAFADQSSFRAGYSGTFSNNLVTGQLNFSGTGKGSHVGQSAIVGQSQLGPPDPCQQILADSTVITAANGDQLFFQNSGSDCFDPTTFQINGTATYTIVGGTGHFAGVTGTGAVAVSAQVTSVDANGVATGYFMSLTFNGGFNHPEHHDCDGDDD